MACQLHRKKTRCKGYQPELGLICSNCPHWTRPPVKVKHIPPLPGQAKLQLFDSIGRTG